MIAYVLSILVQIVFAFAPVGVSAPNCECDQDTCHVCESTFRNWMHSEEAEWSEFHAIAFAEYADEFTALFESYSYKLSKNGRSMVNGKFVKMS